MHDVTVVIPAYNRADMIADAIRSALPVRVLVVDDASTDETADVAEKAGAEVLRCDTHVGMTANFNRGIRFPNHSAIFSRSNSSV